MVYDESIVCRVSKVGSTKICMYIEVQTVQSQEVPGSKYWQHHLEKLADFFWIDQKQAQQVVNLHHSEDLQSACKLRSLFHTAIIEFLLIAERFG